MTAGWLLWRPRAQNHGSTTLTAKSVTRGLPQQGTGFLHRGGAQGPVPAPEGVFAGLEHFEKPAADLGGWPGGWRTKPPAARANRLPPTSGPPAPGAVRDGWPAAARKAARAPLAAGSPRTDRVRATSNPRLGAGKRRPGARAGTARGAGRPAHAQQPRLPRQGRGILGAHTPETGAAARPSRCIGQTFCL